MARFQRRFTAGHLLRRSNYHLPVGAPDALGKLKYFSFTPFAIASGNIMSNFTKILTDGAILSLFASLPACIPFYIHQRLAVRLFPPYSAHPIKYEQFVILSLFQPTH